jgi:hypothetical protein
MLGSYFDPIHPPNATLHKVYIRALGGFKGIRKMRPFVWGLILTVLGAFFLISLLAFLNTVYAPTGAEAPPFLLGLAFISGLVMLFSLPIASHRDLLSAEEERDQGNRNMR